MLVTMSICICVCTPVCVYVCMHACIPGHRKTLLYMVSVESRGLWGGGGGRVRVLRIMSTR